MIRDKYAVQYVFLACFITWVLWIPAFVLARVHVCFVVGV